MSSVQHEVSLKKVAANQSNSQRSTGPRTAEGQARAALNSIKHGAYAKADNFRRRITLRRGEDPQQYGQVHHDLLDSWHPDDAMQAMVVRTIGDRAWEKLQLAVEAGLAGKQLSEEPVGADRRDGSGRRRKKTAKTVKRSQQVP